MAVPPSVEPAERGMAMSRKTRVFGGVAALAAVSVVAIPSQVTADASPPVFGLGTSADGDVLVAATSEGITDSDGAVIVELPGVTDVAGSDGGWWWAITGGPPEEGPTDGAGVLYKAWPDGTVEPFADLLAYEQKYNPDGGAIESNPWSVVDFGRGEALVADAAGNSILKVNKHGKVKLVATLPTELVSTANVKSIVEEILSNLLEEPVSCAALPELPPELDAEARPLCELPPMIPAEAVATGLAVGPDGAIYVGELKGFPAPTDESRVWRIERNARNADCGRSPLCSVAYDGFTSIVDLAFSPDGVLHVAELSEKSWFAFELGVFAGLPVEPGPGTINACSGGCSVLIGGVAFPTAITFDGAGQLWWGEIFGAVTQAP